MRGMHGFTPFRASPRNAHFKPVPLRPYDDNHKQLFTGDTSANLPTLFRLRDIGSGTGLQAARQTAGRDKANPASDEQDQRGMGEPSCDKDVARIRDRTVSVWVLHVQGVGAARVQRQPSRVLHGRIAQLPIGWTQRPTAAVVGCG